MRGAGPRDRADPAGATSKPVAVLVVDDQESFRAAMRELVVTTEGFALVGEAQSGEEAVSAADELSPQLVIMDKRMPGIGGIEASRLITSRHPGIVVLLVSVEEPSEHVVDSSGAASFVLKQKLSSRLMRAVWQEHGPAA